MAELSRCLGGLNITNRITNPYRYMTKGEMLSSSKDRETLYRLARDTLSCAHPEAARFAGRPQGNCGYCFPCLIRRAALHAVGLDRWEDYSYDALREAAELRGDRGSDLRAMLRSLYRNAQPIDVLRNGPVPAAELENYAGVYKRGRVEMLTWMRAANPATNTRRQLPES
jgi:hypothetical protein